MARSMSTAAVIIGAVIACGSLAPLARACSCLFTPIEDVDCSNFDLVLVGTVVGKTPSPGPSTLPFSSASANLAASTATLNPSTATSLTGATINPIPVPSTKNIFIKLDECIKDINDLLPAVGSILTFITPTSSAACGITLPIGETFIIFVNTATGQPFPINLCSTKYLLSSGFLSIIKKKCGACKGCVKPPTPVIGPILTDSVGATATLSASSTLDATSVSDAVLVDSITKKNPCKDAECPFLPQAECLPNCECEAEFVLFETLVTDDCTCPEVPEHLPAPCTVKKPLVISPVVEEPCPKIECEFDNTPLCQIIPFDDCMDVPCKNIVFCFVDPCKFSTCPLFPDAECISNYCDGCNAIFVDPETKEFIPKCSFSEFEPCDDIAEFEFSFGLCDLVLGYAVVDGKCKAISGCNTLGFPFFPSMEKCEAECGCPNSCCHKDPCDGKTCPSFPDAKCVSDKCKCTFEFVDEGTVVTPLCFDDCQFPSDDCPFLTPLPAPCFYTKAPQDINGCIFGCQEAICPFDNVPLCPFIPFEGDCVDEPCVPVNCFVDPCSVTSCPAFPSATCISNYCGGCNAIFVDPLTGKVGPVPLWIPDIDWPD